MYVVGHGDVALSDRIPNGEGKGNTHQQEAEAHCMAQQIYMYESRHPQFRAFDMHA